MPLNNLRDAGNPPVDAVENPGFECIPEFENIHLTPEVCDLCFAVFQNGRREAVNNNDQCEQQRGKESLEL